MKTTTQTRITAFLERANVQLDGGSAPDIQVNDVMCRRVSSPTSE